MATLDNALLKRIADNIRVLAVAMPETAKSGHPGGAMGGADFMALLYTEFLNFDPSDMTWPHRDRFFQDAGHLSSMMYATLSLFGKYTMDELSRFRQWESPTPGHPEHDVLRGIENTSGPLGQGHVMGAGAALAERVLSNRFGNWLDHKTVAYITDGGVEEEVSQGVGRIAGHLGLSNFIMFYDSNKVQLSHMVADTMTEDTAKKYEAWGWAVETVNGQDYDEMRAALKRAWARTDKPTFILAHTIMGKGAIRKDGTSYEGSPKLHGNPLSKSEADYAATLAVLGCALSTEPFKIFADVKEAMDKVVAEKTAKAAMAKKQEAEWAAKNPELAKKMASWFKGELPKIDWSAIPQKGGEATRAASRNVMEYLAGKVENLIVMSADLADSDYTEGFLKKTTIFRKGDFSGSFFQAGVAELTMAGIMNGIALHGGLIPVGGTFFVFSDFQKPALRLAALQGTKVIFLWSHDAFRVGEDGPTHEPIEQEAQLRLLERLNNLEGRRSFLALRPGDASETTLAWKLALEAHGPASIVLTRQPVAELPPTVAGGNRFSDAEKGMPKGAYVIVDCEGTPDLILLANGSEASLLVEGGEKLRAKGLKVRVVSAPSEGLFREQTEAYREGVVPYGLPVLGWTAGEPSTLRNLVGPLGKVYGMTRFGASAPFTVLDQKFGYTADNVVKEAEAYLAEYKANVKKIAALAV